MTTEIFCIKLKKYAPQLSHPPFPGELGNKVFHEVSEEAWNMWLNHQTMLINENRLNMLDPEARRQLRTAMEQYFWGDGSATAPAGFTPIK